MTSSHEDADSRYLILKEQVRSFVPASQFKLSRFSYLSGDLEKAAERYYSFQYAMAPYQVFNDRVYTRYLFLDFETNEKLKAYCRDKFLQILFEHEGLAIAQRGRPAL